MDKIMSIDGIFCGFCKSDSFEGEPNTFVKTNQYGSKISLCVCDQCKEFEGETLLKNGYVKYERKS